MHAERRGGKCSRSRSSLFCPYLGSVEGPSLQGGVLRRKRRLMPSWISDQTNLGVPEIRVGLAKNSLYELRLLWLVPLQRASTATRRYAYADAA